MKELYESLSSAIWILDSVCELLVEFPEEDLVASEILDEVYEITYELEGILDKLAARMQN